MSYVLKNITLRTDNSEGGMAKMNEVWRDIVSGKLPLMHDSEGQFLQGLSPISRYSNYESDETGAYDLTIFTVTAQFFADMAQKVAAGKYKKYDFDGADIAEAANKAWARVWQDKAGGMLHRAFTEDYESTVPGEYTKDGRAHCYLYIAEETE
ncbi:MAG: AraC family transcriptional regulator [Faecalibacterium sp.]|jgi:predicted transcriptional regulator YdeE|nr:AraC family transcriptional regulator [Faecalibacterium sp.]